MSTEVENAVLSYAIDLKWNLNDYANTRRKEKDQLLLSRNSKDRTSG